MSKILVDFYLQNLLLINQPKVIIVNSHRIQFIMKSKSLILFCLFTFALSLYRVLYSGTFSFIFLNWNLFLAFVPLTFTYIIEKKSLKGYWFWLMFFGWLLFFPNAPYVITDLKYLNRNNTKSGVPIWLDIVLISSFAINSILLGFISAEKIFNQLKKLYNRWWANIVIITCMLLSGFGVYLGRFERFNSWDIISNPSLLIDNIADIFIHPFQNSHSIELSILFGIMFCLIFFSLHETIQSQKSDS